MHCSYSTQTGIEKGQAELTSWDAEGRALCPATRFPMSSDPTVRPEMSTFETNVREIVLSLVFMYSVRQQQIWTCALNDERRVVGETRTSTEGDRRATDLRKHGSPNQLSPHVLVLFYFPLL